MFIQILGDKFIRDSKFFILKVGNYVFKVPVSFSALREMANEAKIIKEVKKDLFFSKYLPEYNFFFVVQIIPYMSRMLFSKDDQKLINTFFKTSFCDVDEWHQWELYSVVESDFFLKFIKEYVSDDYFFWFNYLKKVKIPKSSSHGDFHSENILTSGEKLFFIDWIRYEKFSSRFFDLFDYYIFSKRKDKESWVDVWLRSFNQGINEIFGVKIDNSYWFAYSLWKISVEIKTLYERKALNKYKCKKYILFLSKLKDQIE